MKYTVKWYRGTQIDGASDVATSGGLCARGAYRAAVEAQTTPGCHLLGVIRESGGRVTVRQLRAWGRIGKMKGGAV